MDTKRHTHTVDRTQLYSYAYLRNLAAAEAAILRGQFNGAKMLRAAAHTFLILGLELARQRQEETALIALLQTNLIELSESLGLTNEITEDDSSASAQKQSIQVRDQMRDLLSSAIESLKTNSDVSETDVPQSLWGCYSCGYVAKVDRPEVCPVCGALAVEFQWFGPFYSATPEHLGQLTPGDITSILSQVPEELRALVTNVSDETLSRKPSATEWSVKVILGHILETDALFVQRVRKILEAQGMPDVGTPIPPWKLQEGKGYETMPVKEILERFRQNRFVSLELIQGLTPEQWSRQGTNRGTSTSVLDLGTWLTRHDQGHTAQIRNLLENSSSLQP